MAFLLVSTLCHHAQSSHHFCSSTASRPYQSRSPAVASPIYDRSQIPAQPSQWLPDATQSLHLRGYSCAAAESGAHGDNHVKVVISHIT